MTRGFPLDSAADDDVPAAADPATRTVAFDDGSAVFDVLASETARAVLARLHRSPAPASDVAEAVGTSVQNAGYHLGRLADAGLVEQVTTRYSEKGREMAVYAPVTVAVVCAPEAPDGPVDTGESDGLDTRAGSTEARDPNRPD